MSTNFAGKTAIVTGSGNGIGAAIAIRLAEAGAAVTLADRDEPAVQAICRQIISAGGKAAACTADIS